MMSLSLRYPPSENRYYNVDTRRVGSSNTIIVIGY